MDSEGGCTRAMAWSLWETRSGRCSSPIDGIPRMADGKDSRRGSAGSISTWDRRRWNADGDAKRLTGRVFDAGLMKVQW